ncbi:hypothetical protein Bca101_059561 [Brassica carinata]
MIPKWESDAEDVAADNIIKIMFVKKKWKWTKDCWEVTDTQGKRQPARKKDTVKDDSPGPRKKARLEASENGPAEAYEEAPAEARSKVTTTVDGLTRAKIEAMFKDIVDSMREGFGTCLGEIKYLSKRVEALEKKVGLITKRKRTPSHKTGRGTKAPDVPGDDKGPEVPTDASSLPEDKGPDVPPDGSSLREEKEELSVVVLNKTQPSVDDIQIGQTRPEERRDAAMAIGRAKSDRRRKPAASQQSPYAGNTTAKAIIPNTKQHSGYNPFAPNDKDKLKELATWLQACP